MDGFLGESVLGEVRNGLKNLTVLYAEDDPVIRMQVVHFLSRRVGKLIEAADGQEAWGLFQSHAPDVVLTDIQMPLMTGLGLAERVKAVSRQTPVIITTAHNEPNFLQEAIAYGVDGYVLKPVDLDQLMTVMQRAAQHLLIYRELVSSRAKLVEYHQHAEKERALVASLIGRMMRPERLADPLVSYWLQAAEMVGGDMISIARSPHGKLYFMLADSTDHGLASTLNLLPINHIFYSMVSRNHSIPQIVEEMNWAVRDQSPTERYVAAIVGCLDMHNRLLEIWNGGLPDAVFLNESGDIVHRFISENLPLGVLGTRFSAQTAVYQWREEGQLLMYSDGLSDAESPGGENFDNQGVERAASLCQTADRLQCIRSALLSHLDGNEAEDDMTLLLVSTQPRPDLGETRLAD